MVRVTHQLLAQAKEAVHTGRTSAVSESYVGAFAVEASIIAFAEAHYTENLQRRGEMPWLPLGNFMGDDGVTYSLCIV